MFKDRLLVLRAQSKLSQEELGNAIGVSQQAVARWEAGNGFPNKKSMKKLCEFFGVTMDFLFDTSPKRGIKIPVLGTVAAGIPIEAVTDIEDYEEISSDVAKKGEFFALRVKGYSMAPRPPPP